MSNKIRVILSDVLSSMSLCLKALTPELVCPDIGRSEALCLAYVSDQKQNPYVCSAAAAGRTVQYSTVCLCVSPTELTGSWFLASSLKAKFHLCYSKFRKFRSSNPKSTGSFWIHVSSLTQRPKHRRDVAVRHNWLTAALPLAWAMSESATILILLNPLSREMYALLLSLMK